MFHPSLITGLFAGLMALVLIQLVIGYIFISLNLIPDSREY